MTIIEVFWMTVIIYVGVSGFDLARPNDSDPYRYLYYALHGDISEKLGGNYRIVDALKLLYDTVGYVYLPYLLIAFTFLMIVFAGCSARICSPLPFLLAVSICSFYLVQPGKDGILALALCSIHLSEAPDTSPCYSHRFRRLITLCLSALSVWIRIQSLYYILIALLLTRNRFRAALFISVALVAFMLLNPNLTIIFSSTDSFLAESRISGTFLSSFIDNNTPAAYGVRFLAYLASPAYVPLYYLYSSINSFELTYLSWLGFILLPFTIICLASINSFKAYLLPLLPVCIFLAASQALHYRYIFLWLPFSILLAASALQRDTTRGRKRLGIYF
jgi:hypothetical protein